MSGEPETKYCSNCKKDIAAANFTMHEVHCRRHLVLCEHCKEPVPRTEMEQHFNEVHAKVPCAQCNLQLEKDHMDQHLESECPKRQVTCQFCELHLPHCDLDGHLQFCGTRTEACPRCGNFIMHKDLQQHNSSNCAYPEPAPRAPSPRQNHQRQQNGVITRNRVRGSVNTRNGTGSSGGFSVADQRGSNPPINYRRNLDDSFDPFVFEEVRRALEQDEGPEMMHALLQDDLDFDFDGSTAASIQRGRGGRRHDAGGGREGGGGRGRREEQRRRNNVSQRGGGGGGGERGGGRHINEMPNDIRGDDDQSAAVDNDMIPCEFCGETFPPMALVHHQSVCDPLASSLWGAEHQTAPHPVFGRNNNDDLMNQWRPSPARPPTIPVINNLIPMSPTQEQGSGGGSSQRVTQHLNDTGDTPYPYDSLESTMLPCEFCFELLPADSLVQHQAMCEGKPATPRVTTPAAAQPSSAFPYPHGSGGGQQRQSFFPTPSTSGTNRPPRHYSSDPTGELLAAMNQDNSSGGSSGGGGRDGGPNQRPHKRPNVPRGNTTTTTSSSRAGPSGLVTRASPTTTTSSSQQPNRRGPVPTHAPDDPAHYNNPYDINLHNPPPRSRGSRQGQESSSSRTRNTLNSLLNEEPQDPPPRQPAPRNQGARRRGGNRGNIPLILRGTYDMLPTGVSARTVNQEMMQQQQEQRRQQRPRGTGGMAGGGGGGEGSGSAGSRRPQRERGDYVFNGAGGNARPAPNPSRRNQPPE